MSPADTAPSPPDAHSESSREPSVGGRRRARLVFGGVLLALSAGLIGMCTADSPPARAWVGNAKSGFVYDSPDAWLPLFAWSVSPVTDGGPGYEVRRRIGSRGRPYVRYRLIIQLADASGRAELRAYAGRGDWLDHIRPDDEIAGSWSAEDDGRVIVLRPDGIVEDSAEIYCTWGIAGADVIVFMDNSYSYRADENAGYWYIEGSWVISADGRTARSDTNRVFRRTGR